jgi:hypothetical protein
MVMMRGSVVVSGRLMMMLTGRMLRCRPLTPLAAQDIHHGMMVVEIDHHKIGANPAERRAGGFGPVPRIESGRA